MALLKRISRFLTEMDAKAATSLFVTVVLLAFVLAMLIFGRDWFDLDEEGRLGAVLSRLSDGPEAILGVMAMFALLALTGFPQILLITATVVAFGPRDGALFSWIATMASATLTFYLGRYMGGSWLDQYGGERVGQLTRFLARRGALASALIRLVPSAPFIVVNAAAGAAAIPIWKYWIGSGVGFIPKIALVASLGAVAPGQSVFQDGVGGVAKVLGELQPMDFVAVAAIVAFWLALLLVARRIYLRLRNGAPPR